MKKIDEQIAELQAEKEKADKRLLNIEIVLAVLSVVSFFVILVGAIYLIIALNTYVVPIILIVIGFAIFITCLLFCVYIEQQAGYYECEKCHHKYIPTFKQSLWSMHMGRTKYMKCPKCQEKSWNKKVLK